MKSLQQRYDDLAAAARLVLQKQDRYVTSRLAYENYERCIRTKQSGTGGKTLAEMTDTLHKLRRRMRHDRKILDGAIAGLQDDLSQMDNTRS